ncbi:hypothetical protein HELRODRAFT_78040, partial [Helobdella robusta]|uniref:Uncharacterized protein n=1 Tax=Helobdella robusta TaxID=6412 RepID=T1G371_HELRO
EPTTVWKFIDVLLMHFCKKILLINLRVKIIFYICSIIIVSMATDHFPLPKNFLSNTNSFANQYFVKYAWTITSGLNALFIYYTSSIFFCGEMWGTNRSLLRLAFGTMWWYICSIIFELIGYKYGLCVGGNQNSFNKDVCSGRWVSFSVSDRLFVLFYGMLMTLEEVRSLITWERLHDVIFKNDPNLLISSKLSENQIEKTKKLYVENVTRVRLTVMILTVLIIMLDFSMIVSILYFNNMPQKLAASFFALLGWLLTYKTWFRKKSKLWSPGSPGDNMFITIR